ncbi:MAG TPA: pyruvate:ferredoxin (flavodoxin) oxidoreductase [Kiritimatiellia bacterium]|nr:pyruvate:ferredoxin (flavodoxin) oxidoreductase [Kiritimatiellia bacterium]
MTKNAYTLIDGNEAAAHVAHKVSEVCAIYPITPSSNMGELADQWSSEGRKNIWGTVPLVVEMQSEGGAAGAVHGALQTGALASTFTASQGLLLMIPNMYKIAGELTPAVFHVSARAIACQGLSIFGDHADIMSVRQTGFALLGAASVQEAGDMALVAHATTLKTRIPFIHFFDGFRTSHEVNKVVLPDDDTIRAMIDEDAVLAHRRRALNPDAPVIRGTAQNPDVYFQGRETVNPFYAAVPNAVQAAMDQLAQLTGRAYRLYDYYGHPEAERVIVLMGSGAETAKETIDVLTARGEKVGLVLVRLFRPFAADLLLNAFPKTVKTIAVLDRCKEPGSAGEPLYQDVATALIEGLAAGALPMKTMPRLIGGRYGLSSKEFTPAMVKAVFDESAKSAPKNHFTVGILDDVSGTSLDIDPDFITESDQVVRAVFYGLGADGTVGANKNSIKIIGDETDFFAQGYFVYDSKKSGSQTVSHLRFGPDPIRSTYLIQSANFVGCHQFNFIEKTDVLKLAAPNSVFLLNAPVGPEEIWVKLPTGLQRRIIEKNISFYVIDAYKVARETGMGSRINTVMQTCFFAISGVLPRDKAIEQIKKAIEKSYKRKGADVVQKNFAAVDHTLAHLFPVTIPATAAAETTRPALIAAEAPEFVHNVLAPMMAGEGDLLPVSKMPIDGTFPTGTTKWEKRNISESVPVWDEEICIQCGMCGLVCPHSVIRSKTFDSGALAGAPEGFKSAPLRGKDVAPGARYVLQVYLEDCTGCGLCVGVCPAKNKQEVGLRAINMEPKTPVFDQEKENIRFYETLPLADPATLDGTMVKDIQYLEPLFEFSGACAGCGETPYVKAISQLFGDRMLVANATGCSSIYGGNLPSTPWTKDQNGRGPAWSNSLFEDNAEFGFGYRLTLDKHAEYASELLKGMAGRLGADRVDAILNADQTNPAGLQAQRQRIADVKAALAADTTPEARHLLSIIDGLVKRSVWIMGGDGWAYDIGYGGLDHVMASGRDVNILVMDTEVYSNTGGQMSKATPRGAVAKFAAGGKQLGKKDLGLLALAYGHVYVARIALGANPRQTLRAIVEAEQYPGPSLIIAYSHCIAHGIDMANGLKQQKLAVDSAYWPLYRFNPALLGSDKNPFSLDSKPPSVPFREYAYNEVRYRMLHHSHPEEAARLLALAETDLKERWAIHENLAKRYQPAAPAAAESRSTP